LRCPHCDSLHTRRKGRNIVNDGAHQRWFCLDCRKSFSPITRISTVAAARCYFEEQASYRSTGHAIGLDGKHVWERIIEIGLACKSPADVSIELQPTWCGYLLVDSDTITVGSHKEKLLLSADVYSQDIPHAALVAQEDAAAWIEFFTVLKDRVRYPLRGLVADGDPAIETARLKVFPDVPFQLCVLHYERNLKGFLKYRFTQKPGYWSETERFLQAVHRLLYAWDIDTATSCLYAITHDPGFKQAGLHEPIANLKERFPQLVTHHFYPGLPRTTNIIEGIISRLDSKITASKSYKQHDTAWATLKLLVMRYRFKPFEACRKKTNIRMVNRPCSWQALILPILTG
jgi:transposase-like protein